MKRRVIYSRIYLFLYIHMCMYIYGSITNTGHYSVQTYKFWISNKNYLKTSVVILDLLVICVIRDEWIIFQHYFLYTSSLRSTYMFGNKYSSTLVVSIIKSLYLIDKQSYFTGVFRSFVVELFFTNLLFKCYVKFWCFKWHKHTGQILLVYNLCWLKFLDNDRR